MASYNPNNLSPDELSCPICFEEYSNNFSSENVPKLLLCLHTFCLGCIRGLVKSNRTVSCSICRAEHTNVVPQELFDNYVIMEHIRKEQEESDAALARQHSEDFLRSQSDVSGPYQQQQQEQLRHDALVARRFQNIYDNENAFPEAAAVQLVEEDDGNAAAISAPTVSVVQAPEMLCTAQESPSQPIVVASCSRPCRPPLAPTYAFCRSTSNSASSSSPSTSTVITNSSNTSSDSNNSDDTCSSRQSSSSRLEEEFVDTVETLEIDEEDAGIAGASADDGDVMLEEEDEEDDDDDASDSPQYRCNLFRHHYPGVPADSDLNGDAAAVFRAFLDDRNHVEDSDDDSLHLGETFSEHQEVEAEDDNLDGDDDSQQVSDQEDELFNNFSVLESIDPTPEEGPAASQESYDGSCISISSTESDAVLPRKQPRLGSQLQPIMCNFPLSVHSDLSDMDGCDDHTVNSNTTADDDSVTTITLDDSQDSSSNATNKTYTTRSTAASVEH